MAHLHLYYWQYWGHSKVLEIKVDMFCVFSEWWCVDSGIPSLTCVL